MAVTFPSLLHPTEETRSGRMLIAGDVRVTLLDKIEEQHITVRFKSLKDNRVSNNGLRPVPEENRNWVRVPLKQATHVFIEVPSSSGDFPDKIGSYYPRTGRFFEDRHADPARVQAACIAARWLNGGQAGKDYPSEVLLHEESNCGICGRTLTDPESIELGIGPECNRQQTNSQHQQKQLRQPLSNDEQANVDAIIRDLNELSDSAQLKVLHELQMWHSQTPQRELT